MTDKRRRNFMIWAVSITASAGVMLATWIGVRAADQTPPPVPSATSASDDLGDPLRREAQLPQGQTAPVHTRTRAS